MMVTLRDQLREAVAVAWYSRPEDVADDMPLIRDPLTARDLAREIKNRIGIDLEEDDAEALETVADLYALVAAEMTAPLGG